ncbi:MAG: tRNA (adenosine(37)-N6)-threonylcarbamoyltransferase complex dimerization subunit type 1 TsaB [Desulfobacteraceae bacterium]|nr:MAG: tRNA (adenosine(37)-N6)-threonylcarbamoyltransferase complex dimerization subunit type 1 TsaB [Desulfobacteraceae bacterium]
MRILAVDTASRTCSVAVLEDDSVMAEFTANHRDTHSRFLMQMIDDVLAVSRFTITDMDGFALTTGPGSFTGLRIGLSAVKGLAVGADKPVVGVSSLEALAFPFSYAHQLICPLMDARRHEVYTACYRGGSSSLIVHTPPQVTTPEKAVSDIKEPCIFVGDGAVAYRDRIMDIMGGQAFFADSTHHQIRASVVAAIAMHRFKSGDTDDASAMTPCYIRKSDAEKMIKG